MKDGELEAAVADWSEEYSATKKVCREETKLVGARAREWEKESEDNEWVERGECAARVISEIECTAKEKE